jgi:hypothetical protein
MEPEDLLPHIQDPDNRARSIQSMPPSHFLKIHFNIMVWYLLQLTLHPVAVVGKLVKV